MDKEKVISEIFDAVLNNGIETSKNDILGEDINDRVYTKIIKIDMDYEFKNGVDSVEVVCVSMTCLNEDMSDVSEGKVRINMKNRNNSWINIFLHEAPDELIDFIHKNIH